ncbi:hypothetical protein B0H12DRAFT_159486 [Mycena haematopus]|nr:hypothetical protein B0H12DRAFT_159486 [Mycena haematopus]
MVAKKKAPPSVPYDWEYYNWLWTHCEAPPPGPPPYAFLHYSFPDKPVDPVDLDTLSRDDLVAYCTPSAPRAPAVPCSQPPHILTLDPFKRVAGYYACVFFGKWAIEGEPPSDVVFKTYPVKDFKFLINELDVYTAIAHLAPIVPTLLVILKPSSEDEEWGGLLLENAGTVLADHNTYWQNLGLSLQERILLYETLCQLHSAGIIHGDVTPRNVVRRPGGAFCFVDFERSTLNHSCPGETCQELAELHNKLDL